MSSIGLLQDRAGCPVPRACALPQGQGQQAETRRYVSPVSHILTTEPLVLRPVTTADHGALLAHWTSEPVRRFMFDGAVLSATEVSRAIADSSSTFLTSGYGLWILEQRGPADPGALAGTAGLRPLEDLGLEVIWSLSPAVQGRGLATEAA